MNNQDSTQNVPVLRLDGFEGEWAERPLGSFAKRVQRKNTDLESTLPLTISAQYGLVDQITYFNNRVASDNLVNYLLVKNGEFAYNKSFSAGHPVGTVKRLDKYDSGALSTLYIVFRIVEDGSIDSDYLVTFFETSRWHRFVEARSAEGARNHGLLNISAKDFLDVPVSLAPTKHEQQAIGAVFTNLDAAIDQHTDKHRVLQHTKTALMQRMFPQDGQTEPDLRLDGFEGAWGLVEVDDVATRHDNERVPVTEKDRVPGSTPYYGANGIQDYVRGYTHKGPIVLVAEDGANDLENYPVMYVTGTAWVNNHAHVLRCKSGVSDEYFLKTALTRADIKSILVGGGRAKLNAAPLMSLPFLQPTVEEQQAIGAVFTKLDTLISAEAQLIEKLKQTKTALLQKMFV